MKAAWRRTARWLASPEATAFVLEAALLALLAGVLWWAGRL